MSENLLKDRVVIAKTRMILSSVKINALASLVVATVLAIILGLGREQSLTFLLWWYAVFVGVVIARLYHAHTLSQLELTQSHCKLALFSLTSLAFASGLLWGVLGFICVGPEQLTTSIIFFVVFSGLIANATATLSHVLPLFISFIFPILLPAAYKFYSFGEVQYYWIAGLILFYLGVTLINIRGIRAALVQSIKLRYENFELIETLKVQNAKAHAALEKAEQANIAKSRFFAAASHDLRQPMQSLSMFTATLASKSRGPEQKKIVSQIEQSVSSLEGLFNALLDVSSLDAGTLKFQKTHICLQKQVHLIADEFVDQASANSLTIETAVDEDVVFTDAVLLGRMLRNLVDNAIRYTPRGGIVISSELKDDRVLLSIADTGIGITPDMQSSIYTEFVQLNNPERDRNKGLGLGLSIVQRICDMLDMKLTLSSNVDEGSTFTVSIECGDIELIAKPDPVFAIPASIQNLFVLVIDDEEDVRLSLEGLLVAWGCVVMVASSGDESVRQLIEYGSNPDIIISDYRLRNNETGGDAVTAVRDYCGVDIPAIIVTGDIAPERLIEIDKLNVPVLHKPCSPERLRAILLDTYKQ